MVGRMLSAQGLVRKSPNGSPVLGAVAHMAELPAYFRPDYSTRTYLDAVSAISWIYIAVSAISRNASTVPLKAYRTDGDGRETELKNDARVRVIERPFAPFLSRQQLIEWSMMSLLLTGKCFWEVRPNLLTPRFIFPIRADLIEPIPDQQTFVRGYRFTVQGRSVTLPPETVLWARFIHPTDDYDGLSPLRAGELPATTDLTAVKMNLALLRNQARPAGVLTTEQIVPVPVFDKIKEQFLEEQQGAEKSGKPLLLQAGLTYQAIGLPPKEMEYLKGREFTRDEIFAIYRVPPTVAGVPSANYATAMVEERRFWEQAVRPTLDTLCGFIDSFMFPDDAVTLKPDLSGVLALQEDASQREARLKDRFDRGIISANEWREEIGKPTVPGGDQRYMPYSLVPVGTDGVPQPPGGTLDDGDTEDDAPMEAQSVVELVDKAGRLFTVVEEARRTAIWKGMDQRRRDEERKVAGGVARLFRGQAERVFSKLNEVLGQVGGDAPAPHVGVASIFSLGAEVQTYAEGGLRFLTPAYARFRRAAVQMVRPKAKASDVDPDDLFDDWNVNDERARAWLKRKAFKFADRVNRTTQEELREALDEAFANGETVNEMQARVRLVFADTERASSARALMIARTEMASVQGMAMMDGYRESGVERHEWLSAKDENVRDEHQIDGETTAIGQAFSNGLEFPGDPSGDPGQIINCRCSTIPVLED
jgi:HK97 family phage portal protein